MSTSGLWAPIVKPTRGKEWVIWTCIRGTRRDARAAYLEHMEPSHYATALKRVRFARVSIDFTREHPTAKEAEKT